MEQKKILWIILSVSLFLVVVLGIGLIWLRPVEGSGAVADGSLPGSGGTVREFDAIEYIREGEVFPGLEAPEQPETSDGFVATSGEIFIGTRPGETAPDSSGTGSGTPVVVAPARTAAGAAGTGTPGAGAADSGRTGTSPSTPDRVPSASSSGSSSGSTASSAPAPAARTQAPPARPPAQVKEFWIQAAAFESSTRANEVKDQLSAKGFNPVISTRTVDGKNFFRVRLGPYPNESEANKFLGWVKELDGFSSAWVSEVTVTR